MSPKVVIAVVAMICATAIVVTALLVWGGTRETTVRVKTDTTFGFCPPRLEERDAC